MSAIYTSLARANGRGSAGQCPAPAFAKTPAARESVSRVAAAAGAPASAPAATFSPDGTEQLSLRLLRAEFAQLRDAAHTYYLHSHHAQMTPEGRAAGERLVALLAHAGLVP